jgi:hypothetical protein
MNCRVCERKWFNLILGIILEFPWTDRGKEGKIPARTIGNRAEIPIHLRRLFRALLAIAFGTLRGA